MAKKILITGGAGYIGSHTALELLNEGYEVVVYDNLCNSSKESLKRVEELTGKTITFYEGDVMDEAALKAMLEKEGVDAVIHCAALKAVGESVQKPLEYYRNNITGTLTLMDVMKQTGVKNIVFSSSATVYGSPEEMPITEECPKGQCTNPYGWTKSMMEQIMTDVQKANPDMNVNMFAFPSVDDESKNTVTSGVDVLFAVSNQGSEEQQEAAKEFIRYALTKDVAQEYIDDQFAFSAVNGVEQQNETVSGVAKDIANGKVSNFPDHYYPNGFDLSTILQQFALNKVNGMDDTENISETLASCDEQYDAANVE